MVSSRRVERATPNERPMACGWRRLVALLCFAPCAAMADRFDIVTFDAPPAWERQATADDLVFNVRSAGAESCQVRLSKSRKLVATLPEELERTWSALVARQTLVGEASAPRQLDLGNGLTLAQRFAQVRASGGSFITMLNLFQRDDQLVMVVVIADPKSFERCNAAIGEFLAGLRLDKVVMPQPPLATGEVRPAVGCEIRRLRRRDVAIRADGRHVHFERADAGTHCDRDPVRA